MTHPNLSAARILIHEQEPYLGPVLWRVRFKEVPEREWPLRNALIATDETGLVRICDRLLKEKPRRLAAEVVHELGHILRDHFGRRGDRIPELWNIAGDATINPDVISVWGEENLPSPILPALFALPENQTAETYYEMLLKKAKRIQVSVCCGGASGNRHPSEQGGGGEEDEGKLDPEEWDAARVAVAAAIREHRKKGRGQVPGGLDRWAEAELKPSPVDWRRVLSGAVKGELKVSGAWDYTYARPSRRRVGGAILPSLRSPCLRATIIIDTSGSRGQEDLAGDLADVRAVLKSSGCQDVSVLTVDAAVHGRKKVRTALQAGKLLEGGGGTDMRVGIEEACKAREKPQVLVVLTDGETPWPKEAPPVRTVVVLPEGGPETPEWAVRVERIEGASA